MTTAELTKLRDRIAKLDRLAGNNPNPHEAANAKAMADRLRLRLPDVQPSRRVSERVTRMMREAEEHERAFQEATRRSANQAAHSFAGQVEKVNRLNDLIGHLDARGIEFAESLVRQFRTRRALSRKQWEWVDKLIERGQQFKAGNTSFRN